MDDDAVFRALADPHRRQLLDRLFAADGLTLSELCGSLAMTRQGVSKHLALLERAGLVVSRKQGRDKVHFLNAVPIHAMSERWVAKYQRRHLEALSSLKAKLEEEE